MIDVKFPDVPFVRSVLHPTDFSDASENAFAHALALSVRRQTLLTLFHVTSDQARLREWSEFPGVRQTLERWGLLEEGADRSAVGKKLGVDVEKLNVRNSNVLEATLDYIEHHATDLIVLSTAGRQGVPRWIHGSVAEKLARHSRTMTLFVPEGARGFVDSDTGRVQAKRILVPVDQRPDPRAAIAYASRAARMTDNGTAEIVLLHVGSEERGPEVVTPEIQGCKWSRLVRDGDVVDEIASVAEDREIDLIVMATEGRHGILDALRGSVTEQVLRQSKCPLLGVPADERIA